MSNNTQKYIELISAFLADNKTVDSFKDEYLSLFKSDGNSFREEEYQLLDGLFCDLDYFCSDPNLFEDGDLDEYALRVRARETLDPLKNIL